MRLVMGVSDICPHIKTFLASYLVNLKILLLMVLQRAPGKLNPMFCVDYQYIHGI